MSNKKHIHRYARIDISHAQNKEYWVMKCNLPECSYYIAGKTKLSFPQLRGQIATCNRCNSPFILDKRALRMAEPCCQECVIKKGSDKIPVKIVSEADKFFEQLENNIKNNTNEEVKS